MKPKKQRLIRAARIERHVLLGVLAASLAVPYAIYGMLYRGADIPQFLEWILFPGWVLNHFTTGDDMMKYPSAVSRFSVIFGSALFLFAAGLASVLIFRSIRKNENGA